MQTGAKKKLSRPLAHLSLLLCALLLLSACAAVTPFPTTPFQDYQSSISTLKDQSDRALKVIYDRELEQFKKRVTAGDMKAVALLRLNFPPEQYFAWEYGMPIGNDVSEGTTSATDLADAINTEDLESAVEAIDIGTTLTKPLFASVGEMRQTMASMNTQLLNYAGLLLALAGADDSTQFNPASEAQKFDAAATSLFGQLKNLGVNTSGISSNDLALFSTVAANLANNYLESKRADLLTQVLNEGLQPLQAFADQAKEAMAITATNAETQYFNQTKSLFPKIVNDKKDSDLDVLLDLNDTITGQLDLYKNIANGYAALPNSQRQLISAVQSNREVNLTELISYATSIQQQYEALADEGG